MVNQKVDKFFKRSISVMIIMCILVFVWLTIFMSRKTEQSAAEISEIYMSEVNKQIQQKFSSIIALRMEQVEGIIKRVPIANFTYGEEQLQKLAENASIRNFTYLGFYTESGKLQKIYGEDVKVKDGEEVKEDLTFNKNGDIVVLGVNEKGEKILILGKKADYLLENGEKSVALVAGLPMEYLNEALFLYDEDAMVYSHIIDEDGSFIIRNGDTYSDSYFERVRGEFDELHGKAAEDYISELSSAMEKRENYATFISVNGEERHIYCAPLSENAGWYLVSVMPNGVLRESMENLDTVRITVIIASLAVILVMLLYIFYRYYKLSRQYIEEIDEAKKEAVHANMAKSEFLSKMSHDIRTPMNAIVGMTEIALKNIEDTEKVNDCLKKVKLSSKHLLGLISDILDMSKIESGKMNLNNTLISLKEVMDDIVNIMQPQVKARNQKFDIFIQKIEAEKVYCDSVRLNQVLLNILSNAVKFTPEDGKIDVYIYQEPSPEGEGYVRTHFRIKDNGIGMSKEFQAKIWDSFVREETETVQNINGTGLGMAITKHIVDIMGGTIELESELGSGSEFHITLDLKMGNRKDEDMKLPPWNILVVDDDEALCLSAVDNLEELGVHAEWTVDGEKAVQMVEEHYETHEDYQFLLIDWKMPSKDGIQRLNEIRKKIGEHIPAFLISAYDLSDIEKDIDGVQIEGFIQKPLFKSTLYENLIRYAKKDEEASKQEEQRQVDLSGKHILLAEDIDMNWEIANEILTSFGMQVERAINGKVCVEKFKQSEIGFYDAVLMDIRMPVMNGYDAAMAIRALERSDKNIPIIAMTADAFQDDIQRCLECGMNAHMAKPLNIKELIQLLEKYLQEK